MGREPRGPKGASLVANNTRLDHDAMSRTEKPAGAWRARRSRPSLKGGLQHLRDEVFGLELRWRIRPGRTRTYRARSSQASGKREMAPNEDCAGTRFEIPAELFATCPRPTGLPGERQGATASWMTTWQGLLSRPPNRSDYFRFFTHRRLSPSL
jgi:hypothetical protein